MTHPTNCEQAQNHACRCTQCGGIQHGWQYKLELAYAPPDQGRDEVRERADTAWTTATRERKRKIPTFQMKVAAVDTATADLLDWLTNSTEVRDNTKAIGDTLVDEAIAELERTLGADGLKEGYSERLISGAKLS